MLEMLHLRRGQPAARGMDELLAAAERKDPELATGARRDMGNARAAAEVPNAWARIPEGVVKANDRW